jgi:plasmid stabilization system protein ParE
VNVVLPQQAAFDLHRLRASLAETNPRAAQRAAAALAKAIQSLELFPDRGHPSKLAGMRELIVPFGRSAYVVRYGHFAEAHEVVIVRIWHGRERRD